MLPCKFCQLQFNTINQFIKHQNFHRNLAKAIHCGFNDCGTSFTSKQSFRTHLIRKHHFYSRKNSLQSGSSIQADNCCGEFICTVNVCKKHLNTYKELLQHLKSHIKNGQKIKCPFPECEKSYNKETSFTGHLSRNHKREIIRGEVLEPEKKKESDDEIEPLEVEYSSAAYDANTDNTESVTEGTESEEDWDNLFLMNLAYFYLKLEAQLLIPVSSLQFIVEELSEINFQCMDVLKKKLMDCLLKENLSEDKASAIVNDIASANPFLKCNEFLKSDYRRKNFIHKNCAYVEPEEKLLMEKNGKKKVFHYVPIIDTLKACFQSKSFELKLKENYSSEEGLLRDFYDGSVFKENRFFSENPEALKLILYQDSFQIVNPIGPSRRKYKMLAVYLSIGNLPYEKRSDLKNIQLVALCPEKFFSHEKVYGTIVSDLQKIENGIKILPHGIIKGSLLYIVGDNLGSHGLGGFLESFGKTAYICRFCHVTRKELWGPIEKENVRDDNNDQESDEDDGHTNKSISESDDEQNNFIDSSDDESETSDMDVDDNSDSSDMDEDDNTFYYKNSDYIPVSHKPRTPETYRMSLENKNKYKTKHYEGIKFDSVFNKLKHYHVCAPGLPSCLGHDLMEGIIAYDLRLMISYFANKKKWFTIQFLNERIANFRYSTTDGQDKPESIAEKSKKLNGGAWQILTLLRLFPLLIGDKIKDFQDEVWQSLLKLTEITEMVCSPEIHISYLPYMQAIIEDYIDLRLRLFPDVPLRPKHHFLEHYPELTEKFGPLLKVFTLRFESKHSFFKRVIRAIKNFKNPTYSLSEKHELFQSLQRSGAGIKNDLYCGEIELHSFKFNEGIKMALENSKMALPATECSTATFKSLRYKIGDIVAVRQFIYQYNVEMGLIRLILMSKNEELYFLLEILETEFQPLLRLYETKKLVRYECLKVQSLLSPTPLNLYTKGARHFVKLRHALLQHELC